MLDSSAGNRLTMCKQISFNFLRIKLPKIIYLKISSCEKTND